MFTFEYSFRQFSIIIYIYACSIFFIENVRNYLNYLLINSMSCSLEELFVLIFNEICSFCGLIDCSQLHALMQNVTSIAFYKKKRFLLCYKFLKQSCRIYICLVNSFHATCNSDFCRLLITVANSLEQIMTDRNGPELDPNHLML